MAPQAEPTGAPEAVTAKTNAPVAAETVGEVESETQSEIKKEGPSLPPLTSAEFKEYNRLADSMTYFHNHFKHTWNMMYTAAANGRRPAGMSLKQFIDTGLAFVRQLTVHHNIEEDFVYPQLAPRMAEFRGPGGKQHRPTREQSELVRQHREIHEGMDRFEHYLTRCRRGELDLDMATLKSKMDDWNDVLWLHLDAEVETLGAENMRKYWSLPEMRRLQI